jgi:hypothetical protein
LAQALKESKLDPATFVADATDQFKKWFLLAGAKNVSITTKEITCGSIRLKSSVMATHIYASNEDFRAALNTNATVIKMEIQGRVVKPSELKKFDQPTSRPTDRPTNQPTNAEIAGIIIGVLVVLLLIGFVIFKSKKSIGKPSEYAAYTALNSTVKLIDFAE